MKDVECRPKNGTRVSGNEGDRTVNRDEAAWKLKKAVVLMGLAVVAVGMVLGLSVDKALAQNTGTGETLKTSLDEQRADVLKYKGVIVMSIAVLVGAGSVAAAFAVARVGSAALGAVTERPEMMGRALIFVALAEGIAIYGLLMAILLLGELK